eukprot:COSAG02_NODE_1063_length_14846_cov_134.162745_4_plen_33_part_00
MWDAWKHDQDRLAHLEGLEMGHKGDSYSELRP